MTDTRVPMQKRSIEKKQRILDAGFELFCLKGYYKTNTIEIAKRAGVSTGAVYSYFKDKKQIYIVSFENHLDALSIRLFEQLYLITPFELSNFVDTWITSYLEIYGTFSSALVHLRTMVADDSEINHHFSNLENIYFSKIVELLRQNGIEQENLFEKVYTSCVLIDSLRQENSLFPHNELDFSVLRKYITSVIINLLSD